MSTTRMTTTNSELTSETAKQAVDLAYDKSYREVNIDDLDDEPAEVRKQLRMYDAMDNAMADKTKDYHPLSGFQEDDFGLGMWETEFKAIIDKWTLKSLFFSEQWVFIATDLIASKVSRQPFMVHKRTETDRGKIAVEPLPNHSLSKRLADPNEEQGGTAFRYNEVVELVLGGNAISWVGNSTIQILDFEKTQVNFNEQGRKQNYIYATNFEDFLETRGAKGTMTFPLSQIHHAKKPNPASIYWGLSPFIPTRKSLLFDRYSQDYLNGFYLRQALPGLVLEMDDHVNEKVALRMLRTVEQAHTGRANQRRTMVLPRGVHAKEMAHSIADQNLVELVKNNREVIINALKIPKHELSLSEAGSLGSEEYKMAIKNFWASTIIPTQKLLAESWTKFFRSELAEDEFLAFDNRDIEALREDEVAKAELAQLMKETHTINEIRAKLYDEEPHEDGDELGTQGGGNNSKIPFNGDEQGSEQPEPEDNEPDPEPESDETDEKTSQAGSSISPLAAKVIANQGSHIRSLRKQLEDEERAVQDGYLADTANLLQSMLSVGIRSFTEMSADKGVFVSPTEKAFSVDTRRLRNSIKRAMNLLSNRFLDFSVDRLQDVVRRGYGVALEPVFDLVDEEALIAISEPRAAIRNNQLSSRASESFVNIRDSLTDDIMDEVAKGIAEQQTIQQTARNIASNLGNTETTLARANKIARTETLVAVSLGQAAAMQDSGEFFKEQGVTLKKMWLSSEDDRVRKDKRADHVALNNTVVDYDKSFEESLKFPRDPSAPPAHRINCRCTMTIVPPSLDELS